MFKVQRTKSWKPPRKNNLLFPHEFESSPDRHLRLLLSRSTTQRLVWCLLSGKENQGIRRAKILQLDFQHLRDQQHILQTTVIQGRSGLGKKDLGRFQLCHKTLAEIYPSDEDLPKEVG